MSVCVCVCVYMCMSVHVSLNNSSCHVFICEEALPLTAVFRLPHCIHFKTERCIQQTMMVSSPMYRKTQREPTGDNFSV